MLQFKDTLLIPKEKINNEIVDKSQENIIFCSISPCWLAELMAI